MAKQIQLRNVPEDIRVILIREQAELKEKCNCQKSLETTIYSIIRQLKKTNNNETHIDPRHRPGS